MGCVVFFINGIVTGNALSVGLIFAGQRFGSSYLALCGGIVLITGTAHNFIGGMIQAALYENYGIWKPIYWGLGCLMSAYFVIFAFCIAFDSAKVDGKRSISFRKQSNALSNCSQAELDLMDMSVL
jgi:membrane-bound ClpP family serine protease